MMYLAIQQHTIHACHYIPIGQKGDSGDTGPSGPKGDQGKHVEFIWIMFNFATCVAGQLN